MNNYSAHAQGLGSFLVSAASVPDAERKVLQHAAEVAGIPLKVSVRISRVDDVIRLKQAPDYPAKFYSVIVHYRKGTRQNLVVEAHSILDAYLSVTDFIGPRKRFNMTQITETKISQIL